MLVLIIKRVFIFEGVYCRRIKYKNEKTEQSRVNVHIYSYRQFQYLFSNQIYLLILGVFIFTIFRRCAIKLNFSNPFSLVYPFLAVSSRQYGGSVPYAYSCRFMKKSSMMNIKSPVVSSSGNFYHRWRLIANVNEKLHYPPRQKDVHNTKKIVFLKFHSI